MYSRELIKEVKELMERSDVIGIAHRLHLDPTLIQAVMDFINGVT